MLNRIIFDCERMKYDNTGLYHYCLNLGNHISKSILPGEEEITFYCPFGIERYFGKACRHIEQTELHKFRMPDLNDYHIWHATYQDSYYLPFINKHIKVILTIHDLNFMYDPSKSAFKKQKYLRRLQMLVNRADVIICVSEYSKRDVLFYCDTDQKPIYVIHNGTNRLATPLLHQHSYSPQKPFIFSLGTVNRKKNFHTLLALVQQKHDLELVIAGKIDDKDYYDQILYTAFEMGISDKVHLTGQIDENEKSWYFNNCYAFAFPSMAEGFGLPVAEAMSIGKPLFLSNKTALPEIAGNVAYYFKDFSETLMQETFASGMQHYKKFNMQEDIKKKGKEFCWEEAARKYCTVYRSLSKTD